MDGETEDIPGHFKDIYGQLFNSVDDKEDLIKISDTVESKINFTSIYDVQKVTPAIVKEASKNLKKNKSDPLFSFSTDCIKTVLTIFMKVFPCS